MISVDFETSSLCNLKDCGQYVYAKDPSTVILCASFRNEFMETMWTGGPLPAWVLNAINDGEDFAAFNAAFERNIWNTIGVNKYGFPPLSLDRWHCTMAQVSTMGMPKALGTAASFIGLDTAKDKAGARAMGSLSRPDKKTGVIRQGTPAQLQTLYDYCTQDTKVESRLAECLPQMSPYERRVWLLDQEINDRGIPVDRELAIAAQALWEKYTPELEEELSTLTGGEATGTKVKALKNWLAKETGGAWLCLDKGAIAQALADPKLSAKVKRVLEIRLELGSSGIKKFAKFVSASLPHDQRVRGTLRYHGAATGRFAGFLLQPQNLPRPTVPYAHVETAIAFIKAGDIDSIRMLFGSVSDTLTSMVRATVYSERGLQFIDYASIEARVVAWLAGQDDLLTAFREKADAYVAMASVIYGKPASQITKDERFIGKSVVLGCGYGMGPVKFKSSVENMSGVKLSEAFAVKCVATYREVNDRIVALWKRLDAGVRRCINNKEPQQLTHNLSCRVDLDESGNPVWLFIKLPSGRELAYYRPKVVANGQYFDIRYTSVDGQTGQPMTSKLYGGAICENVAQAVARDLMVDAMLNLDSKGFETVLTVHDEIVIEGDVLSEAEKIMRQVPDWAEGLPVEVEGKSQTRYYK